MESACAAARLSINVVGFEGRFRERKAIEGPTSARARHSLERVVVRYGRRASGWMKLNIGDRVRERDDGRHEGRLDAIVRGYEANGCAIRDCGPKATLGAIVAPLT